MERTDMALKVRNVRLLSAVYFSLLSIIAVIVIDTFLYLLGITQILPIFKSVLLSVILSAIFGALFGPKIIHTQKPYHLKAFGWGFLMVIVALPFYNLALILTLLQQHPDMLTDNTTLELINLYFFSMLISFIIAGLWIAIAAGFAAIYLRHRLVYDILQSQYTGRELPLEKQKTTHRKLNPNRVKKSH